MFAVEFESHAGGWYFVQAYDDWQDACRNAARYSEESEGVYYRVRHPSDEAKSPVYYCGAYCGGYGWK